MSKRSTHSHPLRKLGKAVLIVAIWLLVWQILASLIDNRWLACTPLEAAASWIDLAATGTFWFAIACSLGRIALGFAVAFLVGVLLGFAAGRLPLLGDFMKPLVAVIKSAPVVCIIALLLVGTGANATTSIVVGLVVFPQFYHAVLESVGAHDRQLDAVMSIFGVPPLRKGFFVDLAALGTSLRAACAIAAGLAWKSGVAAELIGLPAISIGTGVYLAKISLDSATIIAWTATVILLSWLCEKLLLWLMDALLGLPKLMLAKRVRRALRSPAAPDEAFSSEGCALVIDELTHRHASMKDDLSHETTLIYKSIQVAPGERLCVMAPSGAGKTTLLSLVAGILEAKRGAIVFENAAGKGTEREKTRLSIVMQDSTLLPWATPLENIALVARDDAEIRRGHHDLLAVLDDAALAKPIHDLSGGMKRRVELCRALAHGSDLVIADEPFSGLDENTKRRCVSLIDQALCGRTLIMATHDEKDAELLGARIIHL